MDKIETFSKDKVKILHLKVKYYILKKIRATMQNKLPGK